MLKITILLSMDADYVGDEEFYACIKTLRKMAKGDAFEDDVKQEIYETLQCYIKNEHRLAPETIECLFTGYVIRHMMGKEGDPENTTK